MGLGLRELFISIGVDGDTKKLEGFEKKVESTFERLKKGAEVVVEALALTEISEFFNRTIEGAAHVQDLSDKLDVSATTLRNWGFAAQQSGVDFEESAMALGHFNQHVGEAIVNGGEVAQAFAQLNVRLKEGGKARPVVDLLLDVSEAIKKQPDQFHRAAYAQQLFGHSGRQLLPVLAEGRAKIQELMSEADALGSGLGDDFYKNANSASSELENFKFALESIKQRIAAAVLPIVQRFAVWLQKLAIHIIDLTKHTHVVTTGLQFLALILGVKLVGSLRALGIALGLVKESALSTLLAFSEFALVAAIIGLIYLTFDDLYTLMTGGQSVIGETLDKLYGLGTSKKFVEDLKAAWDDMVTAFESIKPSLDVIGKAFKDALPGAILGTAKAMVYLVGIIDDAVTGGRELVGILQHIFAAKGQGGAALDSLDAIDKSRGQRAADRQKVLDDLNGIGRPGGAAAPPGQQPLSLAGPNPGFADAGRYSRAISRSAQVTNNIKVEVHTQSDQPQAVGAAVGQGVATETEKANNRALSSVASP